MTAHLKVSHFFDEVNDVSTTYLEGYLAPEEGRTFPHDNQIPIDSRGVTTGHLMDRTVMKVFFDNGASKSYLNLKFFNRTPRLQELPHFTTSCPGITMDNGAVVPAKFIILLTFMTHGHIFEIYTIVCDIEDNLDLVFGMKNMTETEGIVNTRTSTYDFLECSIPLFPVNDLDVQPGQKVYLKVKAPYSDPLSGMAIAKFFVGDHIHTLKIKFRNNQSVVEFSNQGPNIAKWRTNSAVVVLDLRSLGYFRVTYQRLVTMAEKHFTLHHYSEMRGVDTCQEHCENQTDKYLKMNESKSDLPGKPVERRKGKSTTTHKYREIENPLHDPHPWLEKDDPHRFQTDVEILYEKIDLKESALTSKEKTKLMKMILRYRDAFSLRDEIGGCPNLKADIKVIDESPFFVRPFVISEADKPFMDNQMERLVAFGILSKNSTSHTFPVMLITHKLTSDKRPVVDFRLLNTRILCRNTSIPLMSDILSILGNSDCELLSCVDIKDAFHSIPLTDKSKEFCGI